MIKVENIESFNLEGAVRGMRNPLNSHTLSDSQWVFNGTCAFPPPFFHLGEKDLALAVKLCRAGEDHRKFLRQIFVSMDITAPLYWWKEMDTYKVATTANSESTMHTITREEFSLSLFSHDKLVADDPRFMVDVTPELSISPLELMELNLKALNHYRSGYSSAMKDGDAVLAKTFWWQIIQTLQTSWDQKRTWTGSYENLINILGSRSNHKQDEWREFCKVLRESLPYLDVFDRAINEGVGA